MSYLVLARKWRPQGFDDLIGQLPIVKILENSLEQGKIAHAYVFSGPRGVGKTSTARILAKSLNCVEGPTPTPCGVCDSCVGVTQGISVDVMEIDGASNNSVDDIRDLRERVKYAPSGGKYKVYIIDEAHMLTAQAFNALLKTLEEPPPHVLFVLATTEAKKIPLTVMSRCQHLPFRRVSTRSVRDRLRTISEAEGINISESALGLVARAADGSIRDSLTILDQLASFAAEIEESDVMGLLDTADFQSLSGIAEAVILGDREGILRAVAGLIERGADLRAFTKDLITFFRDILVAKVTSSTDEILDVSDEERNIITALAARVSDEHLTLILSELIKADADVRSAFSPRVALEMSLIKISYLSRFGTVKEAFASISGADEDVVVDVPAQKRMAEASRSEDADGTAIEPLQEPDEADETALEKKEYTGESLLQALVDNLEDPRVSSRLLKAVAAELEGDTLSLTFGNSDAAICAKPFKDDPSDIEELASELRGAPTKLEIHINKQKKSAGRDIKQKAMSEPVVKEALDLFEGRVVNVKQIEDD